MRRVEAGGTWSFFDPHTCPGLNECWGDEYAALYERYEAEGMAVRQVPAQSVWNEILRSQVETGASKRAGMLRLVMVPRLTPNGPRYTGVPYICHKDAANAKSNQQNLGCLKTSNLCA